MNNGIFSVRGWAIMLFTVATMAGCGNDGNLTQSSTVGRTGRDIVLSETLGTGERDALRVKTDAVRGRLWVLGLDGVRVYHTTAKGLIRQIKLPNWSVGRFVCAPDMVLDGSGSAIISSNVLARLWRIDADSFELKEHEISLQGRERWDIGFGALALTSDGTLVALTSSAGSLWSIDLGKGNARMLKPETIYPNMCELTERFMSEFERR